MMKRKYMYGIICAAAVILSGCAASTDTGSAQAEIVTSIPLTGTWTTPDSKLTMQLDDSKQTYEELSYEDRSGSFDFTSENSDFSIGKLFDGEEYIIGYDDKQNVTFSGAVLQDMMIVYSEEDEEEQFYFRDGREEITQEQILGTWEDVNDWETTMEFTDDGTLYYLEDTLSYTVRQGDCGTSLVLTGEDGTTEYTMALYDQFLLLYRPDTSKFFILYQQ